MKTQRINMDIDKTLWENVGIEAIKEGIQKKQLVEKALRMYLSQVSKKEEAKMKVNLFLSNEDVEVIENSKHIDERTGAEAYFTEDDRIVAFDEAANGWVQLGRK